MWAVLKRALLWMFDAAQIKFVMSVVITTIVAYLFNIVINLIQPYLNTSALYSLFSLISPSVWYFLDIANIGSGISLLFGAYTVRFIVRRIPFIG